MRALDQQRAAKGQLAQAIVQTALAHELDAAPAGGGHREGEHHERAARSTALARRGVAVSGTPRNLTGVRCTAASGAGPDALR